MNSELPNGANLTAICSECNEIFPYMQSYMIGNRCPKCGARVYDGDVVYAFDEGQSYELAKMIQMERKEAQNPTP